MCHNQQPPHAKINTQEGKMFRNKEHDLQSLSLNLQLSDLIFHALPKQANIIKYNKKTSVLIFSI